MMRRLKNLIVRLAGRTELFMLYSLRYHSFLADVGWFRSWSERHPVDRNGCPLPWFTYPAISFLERRLKPEMTVFEYGCGNSTFWLAGHVGSLLSCEHDATWYEKVKSTLPDNVQLALREGDEYVQAAHESRGKFDIIVIDGRQRVKCILACVPALKNDGVIIVEIGRAHV